MQKIIINESLEEMKSHGNYMFPLDISNSKLSLYEHGKVECHWHNEIEFMYGIEGEMEYQVNETVYRLRPGTGVFVNANHLHAARLINNRDCEWVALVFNPVLIYGYENSSIYQNYVAPIINTKHITSLFLDKKEESHGEVLHSLEKINEYYRMKEECYELKIINEVTSIWTHMYQMLKDRVGITTNQREIHIKRLKEILDYIHKNYTKQITLEEISNVCGLSKSECCKFFKLELKQTIFDYILRYRIEKSIQLLMKETYSITEISYMVGFSSASYYAQVFKRFIGKTPKQIRNSN